MSDREIKVIQQAQHPIEALDVALIKAVFEDYDIEYHFTEGGGRLAMRTNQGGEYMLGGVVNSKRAMVRHTTLTYLDPTGEEGEFYTNQSMYFAPEDFDGACKGFVDRLKAPSPAHAVPASSKKLDELYRQQSGDLFFESHYNYLDSVLNFFWKEVFGKTADEMNCGGIVGAHGDKAYSYKSDFEKAGIPFQRGVLMFLLTYTEVYPFDKPKYESLDWIIASYARYFQRIIRAENALLRSIGYRGPFPLEIFKKDSGEVANGYQGWSFWENGVPLKTYEDLTEELVVKRWLEYKKSAVPA